MNDRSQQIFGVYGIVDTGVLSWENMLPATVVALEGGVRVIQYRDKSADRQLRFQQARALSAVCRSRGVPFIVNDDVALAKAVAANGVHIGQQDVSIATARALLGGSAIIGVSCYNSLDKAQHAAAAGADYVAFGSFFPSTVKPDAPCAKPELLTLARARLSVQIVAIGGVTAANGVALLEAGADALAVISGLFATASVCQAAVALSQLFNPNQNRNQP